MQISQKLLRMSIKRLDEVIKVKSAILEIVKQIVACDEKKDAPCMVELATTGLKQYPGSYNLLYWRGVGYIVLKKYDEAIADETKALEADPKFAEAFNQRGIAYFNTNDFDRAITDFRKAVEIKSDFKVAKENLEAAIAQKAADPNVDALAASINDCDKKGDSACIVQLASKGIELYPNRVVFYFFRGDGFLELKKYDEAIVDFTKALAIDPKFSEADGIYQFRGVAYFRLHNYELAEADFKKALEINPGNKAAASNLEQIPRLKYDEYVAILNRPPDDSLEKAVAVAKATAEVPENKTKICNAIKDQDSDLKIDETNLHKIQQLLNNGELDKFPNYKKQVITFKQEGSILHNNIGLN